MKISVIVPVYNVEKYLDRCVSSIVNQTYKNLEIILIDDGSADTSPALCDNWAHHDDRIRVIHKNNGGVSSARNAGLQSATGDFITFVDSDDWIELDMIDKLFSLITENNAQISCIGFNSVSSYDIDNGVNDASCDDGIEILNYVGMIKHLTDRCCYLCGKLYCKYLFDNLPNLPDNLSVSEDAMLNCYVFKNAEKMVVSNLKKYNYFRHCESVLSGCITYKMIDDSRNAYKIIENGIERSSSAFPYHVFNRMCNNLFLLNSIIRNNKCLDRYNEIKKDIINAKEYAFNSKYSDVFKLKHRIGIVLLMISPKLYNLSILVRKRIRGY